MFTWSATNSKRRGWVSNGLSAGYGLATETLRNDYTQDNVNEAEAQREHE
jgi:hypothetical protein